MLSKSRRLHRSADDRLVAGVCGGLAESFGIDATLLRLLVGLLIIGTGFGALMPLLAIYALLAFVLPLGSETEVHDALAEFAAEDDPQPHRASSEPQFTPEEVDAWDLAKAGVNARPAEMGESPASTEAQKAG